LDWRFDGLAALVSIAPGKAADLVVLAGHRAMNIDDVERVETVFKDGVGYDPAKLMRSVEGLMGLR
jgi:imidazolonepropionase-like amidohydrolase